MTLDLRRGALLSASRLKTSELGMLRLRTLRLVSLSERAVGLQLIQMEIENGEIEITFETSFEGVNLGLYPNISNRISACGARTVPARGSPWRPHRRCRSTVRIFRRPRSAR